MKTARLAAGLTALALVVTGCGGGDGDDSEGDGDATVKLTLSQDVDTLLPMDSNVGDNISVLDVVYDGLVRYDPKTTKPYNYVAEDISSTDNTVWTIKIKDGLTFQNDEPVDADAFVRAWNYAAYGPNAMANNYFFERFAGYDEMQGEYEEDDEGNVTVTTEPTAKELSGLKVVDPQTLEVTLNGPFAGFATMLGYTGFFPVAQECIDDVEACAVKPIGNGPFEIEEWDQGQSLSAAKWDDYSLEETPDYGRIEWVEYSGDSDWADFEAGDVDASFPPPAEWQAAVSDPDLSSRMVEGPGAALTYIGFPMYLGKPFDDIEFRKAISMAIDRDTIIEKVVPGRFVAADSWVVPDGVPGGVAGTCEFCTFDPAAAKAALAKAGGWPKDKKLIIHLGEDEESEAIFKAVGDSIQLNLGIPYELDPTPDYFDRRSARDFTGIMRANWFPDYPLNENYLAPVYASGDPKLGNTSFGYYNADFEALIKEGDSAPDLESAVTKYQEAEKVIASDMASAPVAFSRNVMFYSDRLDNVVLDPFSGEVKLRQLKVN
ncbi:peptide ABC transporter substrate-binding protein [Mumia sp. Pv 4-285]|uniref:peptide ABC transporter substrate-binding protein n=1 Tax=Mumia qirimensis TaxID=3234852 RepID=UPI00351D6A55